MKKFEQLSAAQVRKVEAAANKATGTRDCKLTGYSWEATTVLGAEFVDVYCEICHDYERRAEVDIVLTIPMSDARRSYVRVRK